MLESEFQERRGGMDIKLYEKQMTKKFQNR